MEVHFTPELEAKLAHSAARRGCNPDDLVTEVLTRYFEEGSLRRDENFTHDRTVFEQGLGLFGSPEDAALLDEVVSIAYEERHRQSKPLLPLPR